jgi:nitrite reductase/ring-hydroxylating ferredoxin subunit
MSETLVLCTWDEVPEEGVTLVPDPSGESGFGLVLTRDGTGVRAFRNQCPHAGRPLDWAPGKFLLDHGRLVCAAHGATFRLPDGACAGGPCRGQGLQQVAVRVADGLVRLVV